LGVISLSGEFRRHGKVIYCHPVADGQFCVGLEFGVNGHSWKDAPWVGAT
jgi:hypothetical protein